MADQLAALHPQEYSNFRLILIDSYSESSGRPVVDLPYLPRKGQFESHTESFLLRQIKWQIYTPQENGNLRFILIDSYSESSSRSSGRSIGRSTPLENSNFRFILIDSYSESSGRPGGRSSCRSIPWKTAI